VRVGGGGDPVQVGAAGSVRHVSGGVCLMGCGGGELSPVRWEVGHGSALSAGKAMLHRHGYLALIWA
jgi:hypothetical protein